MKFADLIDEHAEELAALDTIDAGKLFSEGKAGIPHSANMLRYYAGAADKIHREVLKMSREFHAYTLREPIGIVGHIIPWNFPTSVFLTKVSPALAAGCTMVIKPAEETPLSALYYAHLSKLAGIPDGVLNVVTGFGPTAGAAISSHMDIDANKSVQTTLWGNTAQQIDDDFYKTNKGPFIVIVTSTIVKTFRGQYQLSSTFATKLYINLDIPEVAEMRNKYSTKDINIKDILPKGLPKIQDAEMALHNKKTVAEIKNLEWNSETKNLMVTCNAKIININNKYGWYYVACFICKTKVKQVKGVLWCERCKNEPKFVIPR
ncbi:aldehyde dehydrogenase 1-like [Quercus robur]|uniref:aldehyde dehydrogenase 1-like n=1 Tax=Quercus robur TaxID=38942 RepID=UPI0021613C1D|nr:aldehyde dehydrogenase 1-like [Quercus robur]